MSDIPNFLNAPQEDEQQPPAPAATPAPPPEEDVLAPEAPPPLRDPETEARRQGYSWPEINNHIATSTATALAAGYTPGEIDRFLGYQDPAQFEDRARTRWGGAMAQDPALLEDIDRGQFSLDAIPTMRSDYASALLGNEVKGPQDFAYRYAAAALDAAHNDLGLDDSNAQMVRQKQAQAASAAEAAAAGLPTREDLTDAVVALTAGDHEADLDQVRGNLLDHWLTTGQDPTRAAMQAQYDAGLSDKLTSAPSVPEPSLFERLTQNFAAGQEVEAQASEQMSGLVAKHFSGIIQDALNWGEAQQAIADRMEGKPFAAWVQDPEAMETAYGAAFAMMPANIEGSLASFIRRMREPVVPVTDLSKPPGSAIGEAPVSEALKPVEPAKFEHEVAPPPAAEAAVAAPERPADVLTTEPDDAVPGQHVAKNAEGQVVAVGDTPEQALEMARAREAARAEPGAAEPAQPRFVADSTPAERIARIAQDAGEEAPADPNFFENKLAQMGETDPATVELAKANDHVARFAKWIGDVFHDLWFDERGAVPLPGEVLPAGYRARVVGKNYAEDLIRRISTGLGTQRSENIAQGFEQFYKDSAPFMPRFRQEMAKANGGAWADTELGRVLRAIEGDGVLAPDHPAAPYVAYRAAQNQKLVADIEAAVARGDLNQFQARENYIAHMYTPESVGASRGVLGGGRTGSAGWMKERTLPTYADAFAEGYKPRYDNPILIDVASADAHYKMLDTVRMQSIARGDNWMRYYQDPLEASRDGFRPLNGLNSEKIASTVKDGEPGPPVFQKLYGREGFDTIWNNWVGFQNLNRSELMTTIEDGLLKMKNASTYGKLLFPGYHTLTEYKLGMSNGFANALTELGYALRWNLPEGGPSRLGELARGMRDLVTAPLATPRYIATAAAKWRPMYRAMEADPALDAFVGGGGGIGARSKVYSASDSPGIWKLWNRGQLFQELAAEMKRDFTFPSTRAGDGRWRVAGGLASDVTNLATLPLRSAAYGVTNLSAPVWDHMVPLLKSGAAMDRIQTFIRQNPMATDDMVRNYAQTVVRNIEDRMGEYNPANLFWRPLLKRIANQTMLSTGWTYGTVHATMEGLGLGRGFAWNPVATTNLMGQLATIAVTNAAWTYLIDGKLPNSTLDYLIPFATARGLARILLPGEEKEYYDWMKIVADTYAAYNKTGVSGATSQFAHSSFNYATGKLAPMWQAVKAFVTGEDAIGHHIADQPGGIFKFLEQSFAPIFFENWAKAKSLGLNAVENLFGLREAPKQLSDFWGYIANQEKLHDRWSKEELARAGKEAVALGETPPEGYVPSTRGTGGTGRAAAGGDGAGRGASTYAGPRVTPGMIRANPQFYGYQPTTAPAAGTPSGYQPVAPAAPSIGGGGSGVTDLTPRQPVARSGRTRAPRVARPTTPRAARVRAPVIRRGRRVR